MIGTLEVFHDGRANKALAETHYVGDKRATVVHDDLNRLPNCNFLKVCQLLRDLIIP